MKIKYNAPVTLTYTFISAIVLGLSLTILPGLVQTWFATPAPFNGKMAGSYIKLFTHVLGHASIEHYISNFTMILLLGPILEAAYGSWRLLLMMCITALVTGALNILIFPATILMGASGIVFLMIVLASITNYRKGEIPLTFILVMIVFLGGEIWKMVSVQDNISQFTHILGGLVGSFFGFLKPGSGRTVSDVR